jgi:hypothetical protein
MISSHLRDGFDFSFLNVDLLDWVDVIALVAMASVDPVLAATGSATPSNIPLSDWMQVTSLIPTLLWLKSISASYGEPT